MTIVEREVLAVVAQAGRLRRSSLRPGSGASTALRRLWQAGYVELYLRDGSTLTELIARGQLDANFYTFEIGITAKGRQAATASGSDRVDFRHVRESATESAPR